MALVLVLQEQSPHGSDVMSEQDEVFRLDTFPALSVTESLLDEPIKASQAVSRLQ